MSFRLGILSGMVLLLLSACDRQTTGFVGPDLSETIKLSLNQMHRRVARLGRTVPFPPERPAEIARGAVNAAGVEIFPGVDLKDVCGLPVTVDAYLPTRAVRAGGMHAVVLFHPGGWISGYRQLMDGVIPAFIAPKRGKPWIVVNVTYPLGVPMAQVFGGAACAVAWLRGTAAQNGFVHPERIAALGWSAGGHLAGLLGALGAAAGPSRVQAGVSFVGPASLEALWQLSPSARHMLEAVLDGPPANNPKYEQWSPLTYLVKGFSSPTLSLGGSSDTMVPLAASTQIVDHVSAARASTRVFRGGHEITNPELDYVINDYLATLSPE